MRILHLSDTHGLHRQLKDLPAADILVHSGDVTEKGTEAEMVDFLNWLMELPYEHKVFVEGNHDECIWEADEIGGLPDNIHFLQHKGVEIDGVKFFGIGYEYPIYDISDDVDVLVSHEPPRAILDYSAGMCWGNMIINDRVEQCKPKLHLFGHAHESYGIKRIGDTIYSNAALLNESKLMLVNKPRLLELNK